MARKPSASDRPAADSARQIYSALVRTMAFLHQGVNPSSAWKGRLPREPSFAQFKMLMMLRHLGPSTIKGLAAALGISAASASEMVERLVESNMVDRRPDPDDRRRVIVTLTPAAEKGLAKHEELVLQRLDVLLGELGERDARRWTESFKHLGRILSLYQSHEHQPPRPAGGRTPDESSS